MKLAKRACKYYLYEETLLLTSHLFKLQTYELEDSSILSPLTSKITSGVSQSIKVNKKYNNYICNIVITMNSKAIIVFYYKHTINYNNSAIIVTNVTARASVMNPLTYPTYREFMFGGRVPAV